MPDEEKVELFEVKDPSGKKRIFSKFEDGMVYFKFNGLLPPGIWSYHAKLYHDSLYPDTKMTVDVITKCDQDTGIVAEVFTSLSDTPGTDYRPIIVLLSPNPPLSRPDRVRRPGQPRHRVRPGDGGGTARPQGPGDGGRLPAGRVPTRQCGRHHEVPAGAPG